MHTTTGFGRKGGRRETSPLRHPASGAGAFRPAGAAFTIIELVLALVIILILSSLLLVAVARARSHTRATVARNEVKNLETAWLQYYSEYRKWPDFASESSATAITGTVVEVLQGENHGDNNARGFQFVDFSRFDASGNPVNPWGQSPSASRDYYYYVKFDTDYDKRIDTPPSGTARRSVIVWTAHGDNQSIIGSWE